MAIRGSSPARKPAERELVITRVFDASRKLVWKAWKEPERFRKWWGPKDFTAPVVKIDLRPGGKYLWCMRMSAFLWENRGTWLAPVGTNRLTNLPKV